MTTERCDVCHDAISTEALAMGWPIPRLGDGRAVCPDCYGEGAYCADGHVHDAHSDSDQCATCAAEGTPECACGEWSGVPCEWSGPRAETVMVEWMPEQHRASHAAAGNAGKWPRNGAVRSRVSIACAWAMIQHDPEWVREVAP